LREWENAKLNIMRSPSANRRQLGGGLQTVRSFVASGHAVSSAWSLDSISLDALRCTGGLWLEGDGVVPTRRRNDVDQGSAANDDRPSDGP